ncbi:hypothetical protein DMENIID0001_144530 [Sergentomyia squamirostris]
MMYEEYLEDDSEDDSTFDILNSRNLREYDIKKPLNPNNFEEVKQECARIKTYMEQLMIIQTVKATNKTGEPQKMIDSSCGTGPLGFIIDLTSIINIYEEYVLPQDNGSPFPMELVCSVYLSGNGWDMFFRAPNG